MQSERGRIEQKSYVLCKGNPGRRPLRPEPEPVTATSPRDSIPRARVAAALSPRRTTQPFTGPDAYFGSRRVQLATLAARFAMPYIRNPLDDQARQSLKSWLDRQLSDQTSRRLITFSWNAERWHARDLALELVALGYPNVSWYRGGVEAWDVAGYPVVEKR
jgi:hypothetical protein